MEFEFDERKSALNRLKHGVDFAEVQDLWLGSHVIIPAKNVEGENRYAILGELQGCVHIGIYTIRRGSVRIISCYKANKKLRGIYEKLIKEKE